MKPSDLTNLIGTHLLPFTNPRVVCPPGTVSANGRPNIIVATPMRSGTHILIDMILNNIPAYRNRPLYIDLDQCGRQGTVQNDLIGQITQDAGYVIKTHLPIGPGPKTGPDPRLQNLIAAGVVVTVRRDRDDVCKSLARWHKRADGASRKHYEDQYDTFWAFWKDHDQIAISFKDLFMQDRMSPVLDTLCQHTGTSRSPRFTGPSPGTDKFQIYAHKALTRLAGRRAPRIDTSIHTLKSD